MATTTNRFYAGGMTPLLLTFRGKTQSVGAWSKELGIPDATIRSRIGRLGQTVEEALSTPSDARFRPVPRESTPTIRAAPKYQKDDRGRAFSRWVDPVSKERKRKIWGAWGDPDAERAYRRWAAEWLAGGEPTVELVSCSRLIIRYVQFAESHYTKHQKATSEVHGIRAALRVVNDLYGDTAAADFSPTKLMAVQSVWAKTLAAKTCNAYLHRVVRCWSWGVSRELVPTTTADALRHVATIRQGRGGARVSKKRQPANDAALEAALRVLPAPPGRREMVIAILRLQRLTGMRPGEVLEMKPVDIDRTATPWVYCPGSGGKTLHLGETRRVYLGPHARELLAPWLADCPADRRIWLTESRDGGRMVPIRIEYVRHTLAAACKIARVETITPHQLRHTYATDIQRRYEDDSIVAAAIGDTPEVARQVYASNPADAAAKRVAEAVG